MYSCVPAKLDMDRLIDDRRTRIIVCCGSGGVGKTTAAAAIGLRAAERGRQACVLTVDPARRLAQSMGLTSLDNTPRQVDGVETVDGERVHVTALPGPLGAQPDRHLALLVGERRAVEEAREALPALDLDQQDPASGAGQRERQGRRHRGLAGAALARDDVQADAVPVGIPRGHALAASWLFPPTEAISVPIPYGSAGGC